MTDRQLHEAAWYMELHPYGHEINHLMLAQICCSFAGGKPSDYMPQVANDTLTESDLVGSLPGLANFVLENDIQQD